MKKIFVLLITSIILAGCSPSQEDIERAIAQTQTAMPTATATITATPEPTNTPEPTRTATAKPTAAEEIYTAEQYLELVEKYVEYFCDQNDFEQCGVEIKYIDSEKAVIVKTQSDDIENAFTIGAVIVITSFQISKEQYVKTVGFDPKKIEIYFSDGVDKENTYAKWSTIEDFINGLNDYSVPSFELITNRYLGK